MKILKNVPFHPLFFCANPVLALLATNIAEVELGVAVRPLIFSIAGTVILLSLFRLGFKDVRKAALVTSLLVILFFTYGHLYQILELKEIFGVNIGRHRYLILLYAVLGTVGLWLILKRVKDSVHITKVFNLVGLVLLLGPIFQIFAFRVRLSSGEKAALELNASSSAFDLDSIGDLPDIYYIVLDTYTRGDALRKDFNFDNSYFLDELREIGFFVADCSRSNYSYTQGSITAALNLEYIPDLRDDLNDLGLGMDDIWVLLKQSLVRRKLEAIGYKTVAFDTGYEWSQLRDADYYFGLGTNPYNLQMTSQFEAMLVKSTAAVILTESPNWWMMEQMKAINFPYGDYVQIQKSILDQIPQLPSIEGPKFIFAHILIPHVPYVFDPDGKIREDSGFYGGNLAGPINEKYLQEGYTGEIQFINSQILEIVERVLENSRPAPIIIIHGDHGLREENRLQIFNAYYIPGTGSSLLYSSISPVNSFRVVFDAYFGTDNGLLADESFLEDDSVNPVPEYSLECQ